MPPSLTRSGSVTAGLAVSAASTTGKAAVVRAAESLERAGIADPERQTSPFELFEPRNQEPRFRRHRGTPRPVLTRLSVVRSVIPFATSVRAAAPVTLNSDAMRPIVTVVIEVPVAAIGRHPGGFDPPRPWS